MARNKNRIAEIERSIKRTEEELQTKIDDLNRYNNEKKAYDDALDRLTNKDKVDAVIRNWKATESDRELLTFMLENRDKPVEFWTDIYKQSKPKPSLPLSQKSEVKYGKPIDKTTLPVEIRNLPLTDRIPWNELKIKPWTGEIYFEWKKIKEFDTWKEAMDWIYAIEDNPEYQKFIKVKKDAVTAWKQNITDTLIKKSKSFDDITKSSQIKDTVFHGTPNKDFIQFKLGKKSNTGTVDAWEAIWFTNSKEWADYWSNYSKDWWRTLEVKILSKNMAEVSWDEIGGQFGMLNTIEQAKNEWYDWLIIDQWAWEKWYAVFDPENAVTKQYYDKVKANKK